MRRPEESAPGRHYGTVPIQNILTLDGRVVHQSLKRLKRTGGMLLGLA